MTMSNKAKEKLSEPYVNPTECGVSWMWDRSGLYSSTVGYATEDYDPQQTPPPVIKPLYGAATTITDDNSSFYTRGFNNHGASESNYQHTYEWYVARSGHSGEGDHKKTGSSLLNKVLQRKPSYSDVVAKNQTGKETKDASEVKVTSRLVHQQESFDEDQLNGFSRRQEYSRCVQGRQKWRSFDENVLDNERTKMAYSKFVDSELKFVTSSEPQTPDESDQNFKSRLEMYKQQQSSEFTRLNRKPSPSAGPLNGEPVIGRRALNLNLKNGPAGSKGSKFAERRSLTPNADNRTYDETFSSFRQRHSIKVKPSDLVSDPSIFNGKYVTTKRKPSIGAPDSDVKSSRSVSPITPGDDDSTASERELSPRHQQQLNPTKRGHNGNNNNNVSKDKLQTKAPATAPVVNKGTNTSKKLLASTGSSAGSVGAGGGGGGSGNGGGGGSKKNRNLSKKAELSSEDNSGWRDLILALWESLGSSLRQGCTSVSSGVVSLMSVPAGYLLIVGVWILLLVTDVTVLISKLSLQGLFCGIGWCKNNLSVYLIQFASYAVVCLSKLLGYLAASRLFSWLFRFKNGTAEEPGGSSSPPGSSRTMPPLPTTSEEAMKRLLSCKDKDPYSILGVAPSATDDEIKKCYRRQAILVHPDKNNMRGAEDAFKVLGHAFELIGEPEKRARYDASLQENDQLETELSEFADLLNSFREKMQEVVNTVQCWNCQGTHKRTPTERTTYAARYCAKCELFHAAKEGDIWAESAYFGFRWQCYGRIDGTIYEMTDWAKCQFDSKSEMKANSHNVQYRITTNSRSGGGGGRKNRDPSFEEFMRDLRNLAKSANGGTDPAGDAFRNHDQAGSTTKGRRKKSKY